MPARVLRPEFLSFLPGWGPGSQEQNGFLTQPKHINSELVARQCIISGCQIERKETRQESRETRPVIHFPPANALRRPYLSVSMRPKVRFTSSRFRVA